MLTEIGRTGFSKESNQQQGFKFRGIDDVYNAMSPLLASAGLCVLPRVTSRQSPNASWFGGVLFSLALDVEFDLCCRRWLQGRHRGIGRGIGLRR